MEHKVTICKHYGTHISVGVKNTLLVCTGTIEIPTGADRKDLELMDGRVGINFCPNLDAVVLYTNMEQLSDGTFDNTVLGFNDIILINTSHWIFSFSFIVNILYQKFE
jgi:hypothetical protein